MVWVLCCTIVGTLTSPLLVTIDGYGYIRSAQSLFTSELSTGYRWYREPLYPLFLKLIHGVFGSSDWPLVFFQTGLLVVSVLLVGLSAELISQRQFGRVWWVILGVLTINPFYLVYGGMVLKQSLIVFFIAAFVFFGCVESQLASASVKRTAGAGILVVGAVLCSESLGYAALAFGAVLGWTWSRRTLKSSSPSRRIPRLIRTLGYSLAGLLIVGLLSACTWQSWSILRSSQITPESVFVTDSFDPRVTLTNQLNSNLLAYPERVLKSARGTLMLGPTDNTDGLQENPLWLSWQNMFHCGHWDGLPDDDSSRAEGFFALSCRSDSLMRLRNWSQGTYRRFYQLASIALLASLGLSILQTFRRLRLMLFVPIWLLFLHAQRYSNDRYGLSLFPVGSVIGLHLVSMFVSVIDRKSSALMNSSKTASRLQTKLSRRSRA